MNDIFISIIIPTYNRPEYLKQAVMSAVMQDYRKIEVIIVNNGKRKDAVFPKVISDIPVRVHLFDNRLGGAASRNLGVSKARYDWIAFLDDDDIWMPDKLIKQVEIIKKNPSTQFIFHDHYIFDSSYRVYDRKLLSRHFSDERETFLKNLMIYSATGSTSSFLVKRSAFENVHGFDETMPSAQDHDLALRLYKSGIRFYCIPEPLLFYREHLKKISWNLDRKLEGREKILRTKKKLFPEAYTQYEWDIRYFNHYAMVFIYSFNRKGILAFKHAISLFRMNKNVVVFMKLLILICMSALNLLTMTRKILAIIKQMKYRNMSRILKKSIHGFLFTSL